MAPDILDFNFVFRGHRRKYTVAKNNFLLCDKSRKYSEFFISTPNEMRSQEERGRFYFTLLLLAFNKYFRLF